MYIHTLNERIVCYMFVHIICACTVYHFNLYHTSNFYFLLVHSYIRVIQLFLLPSNSTLKAVTWLTRQGTCWQLNPRVTLLSSFQVRIIQPIFVVSRGSGGSSLEKFPRPELRQEECGMTTSPVLSCLSPMPWMVPTMWVPFNLEHKNLMFPMTLTERVMCMKAFRSRWRQMWVTYMKA